MRYFKNRFTYDFFLITYDFFPITFVYNRIYFFEIRQ